MPKFMTTDGIEIFYETSGTGQPLVFIHPPLMGHVVFRYQRILKEKYQTVFYDCRGHGRSTLRPLSSHLRDHTSDLLQLIDHLGSKKVVLVGYSSGGSIALDLALRHPEKVKGIILAGGFPKVGTWGLSQEFNAGIWLMKRKKVRFLAKVLAKAHRVIEEDEHVLASFGARANAGVVLNLYLESKWFDCVNQLEELSDIPMLCVYGRRCWHIRPHRKYFEGLPKAKIAMIEGATHQLPTKFHEPFNHAIDQFLRTDVL